MEIIYIGGEIILLKLSPELKKRNLKIDIILFQTYREVFFFLMENKFVLL